MSVLAPIAAAPPALGEALLEARGLGHRYGSKRGLEPISFTISAPGLVAVTGPNGAGKSTLLRILAGLLRPSAGEASLRVEGRTIAPAERRDWIGYAAPDLNFYDELSVAENLGFAAQARGSREPARRVAEVLARVGLASRATDRVASLSAGMMQRLRIAFALMHGPRVLLLDEPSGHLDHDGRALLGSIVTTYAAGALVVVATNDEREWRIADHRIELSGRGLGDPA